MSVVETLRQTLADESHQNFAGQPEYEELKLFYADMKARGLAVKREYGLGNLDTIGRDVVLPGALSMSLDVRRE